MFKTIKFLIGGVVVLLPHFLSAQSAQKVNLHLNKQITLNESNYFSGNQPFQIVNENYFYSVQRNKHISIYKVGRDSDTLVTTFKPLLNEYYKSFKFFKNSGALFILMYDKVLKFETNKIKAPDTLTSSDADRNYQLNESYDRIDIGVNRVILTKAYNEAVDLNDEPKCRLLILDSDNLVEISRQNFQHDALALTHKQTYLFDVQNEKVLFVNSLHSSFYIYDVAQSKTTHFGDSSLLNTSIDQIPFDTKVVKYTNPKKQILEVIKFASTINYFEGGLFNNDSTIMIVEHIKGRNQSKRKLHFYQYNLSSKQWSLKSSQKFKNHKSSKKYHIFQFYYPNAIQVINNRLYQVEIDVSKGSKRMISKQLENADEIKYALYEYILEY